MVNIGNLATGQFGDSDGTAPNLTTAAVFNENLLYNRVDNKWDRWTGNSSIGALVYGSVSGTLNVNPHSVATLQGTNPWIVQLTSGSVITTGGNSSVQVVGVMPTTSVVVVPGIGVLGSVATLQGTSPWLITGSVMAVSYQLAGSVMAVDATVNTGNSSVQLLGGNAAIGSVTALQGTNPWNIAGSVAAFLAGSTNASIITVGGTSAANQSVSGTVQAELLSTNASVISKLINSSVAALQGTNPWFVQTTGSVLNQYREDTTATSIVGVTMMFKRNSSSSMMSVVEPAYPLPIVGSVSGTVTTNPNPASVQVLGGIAVLGSIATLQGTSPWRTATSITGGITSVSQVGNWNMGPASVQLMNSPNAIGSVAALQGTNPWNVNHTGSGSVISLSVGSVATVFSPASLISGHASTVNSSSGSILVLASVQATLYAYVTDFLLSNTGATTTLVTFTDSDGSIMGKSIAPTGGGAVATAITSPMRTLSTGKAVYIGATTATSTLHAWVGGYKGL